MRILVAIVIVFNFFVFKNMYKFGYGYNDALWRVVCSIDEGTIWTKGFTEKKFNELKIGMSKSEVLAIMGNPLHRIDECIKDCIWAYSKQDSGTSDYDQRWVIFNNQNRVSEIRKSFFID